MVNGNDRKREERKKKGEIIITKEQVENQKYTSGLLEGNVVIMEQQLS